MVIFHSYVSLPEGTQFLTHLETKLPVKGLESSQHTQGAFDQNRWLCHGSRWSRDSLAAWRMTDPEWLMLMESTYPKNNQIITCSYLFQVAVGGIHTMDQAWHLFRWILKECVSAIASDVMSFVIQHKLFLISWTTWGSRELHTGPASV
jgi:hypothetical protein